MQLYGYVLMLVTKSFKFDHITPLLRDLHWLPILKRIQFKILVLTFKILHRDAPGYLCELLNWYHPTIGISDRQIEHR